MVYVLVKGSAEDTMSCFNNACIMRIGITVGLLVSNFIPLTTRNDPHRHALARPAKMACVVLMQYEFWLLVGCQVRGSGSGENIQRMHIQHAITVPLYPHVLYSAFIAGKYAHLA